MTRAEVVWSRTFARGCRLLLLASALLAGPARAAEGDVDVPSGLGIRTELNVIQLFDRAALGRFADAWLQAPRRGLRVLHVGDSHVQPGVLPGALRSELQGRLGDGGYGLMFPYTMARTYSPPEYSADYTGAWDCGKSRSLPPAVPLGVMGMACRTREAGAGFTLKFKRDVPRDWTEVKIYCKRNAEPYVLEVEAAGRRIPVVVEPAAPSAPPFVRLHLPAITDRVSILVSGRADQEVDFELHGVSLERAGGGGVIVDGAGVGGARYRAVLYEERFEVELAALRPDLVIVDYGTNDYLYDDEIKPSLEGQIRRVIGRIRAGAPNAAILLTSAQDLYWRKRHVESGEAFSRLVARIAREEGCALWDWYHIAGGAGSLPAWKERRFAQRDLIHLTPAGYRLKGRLLASALRRTLAWMQAHPDRRALVVTGGGRRPARGR